MKYVRLIFIVGFAFLINAAHASRYALVIGNDSYKNIPALKNARSDAKAMAKALELAGFQVTLKTDLAEKPMNRTIREFSDQIAGGDEAVFFFAGHGVQIGGANYLLPIDLVGESERQVKDDAVALQKILDGLQEQKAKFSLAIIDACRDNPFKGRGRNIGSRGLVPTSPANGQMIVFSAGSGQQALDRLGESDKSINGLFTRVLLREINMADQPVDRVLKSVRAEVMRLAQSVGHDQIPAIYDQSVGDFYFKKAATIASLSPELKDAKSPELYPSDARSNALLENNGILPQKASISSTMTNEDILQLAKAGLSDDVILEAINQSKPAFDTSPSALVLLRKTGISNLIIARLASPNRSALPVEIQSISKLPSDNCKAQNVDLISAKSQGTEMALSFQNGITDKRSKTGFRIVATIVTLGKVPMRKVTEVVSFFGPTTSKRLPENTVAFDGIVAEHGLFPHDAIKLVSLDNSKEERLIKLNEGAISDLGTVSGPHSKYIPSDEFIPLEFKTAIKECLHNGKASTVYNAVTKTPLDDGEYALLIEPDKYYDFTVVKNNAIKK